MSTLPYDYARCQGTEQAVCQTCRRREPGRDVWQTYVAPAVRENGRCANHIAPEPGNAEVRRGPTARDDMIEANKTGGPLGLASTAVLGVTECTLWFRHDRINGWEFNHLADGHVTSEKPTPRFPSQAGWLRATWSRYHCWLTADVPPKVTFVGPRDCDA